MPTSSVLPVEWLDGREVTAWSALEMALAGGEAVMTEATIGENQWGTTPAIWRARSVPYAQFVHIDISLSDGSVMRLASQLDDGNDFYGLYLLRLVERAPIVEEREGIYRTVEFPAIPCGRIAVTVVRQDTAGVVELEIVIGGSRIKLLSGEVYERAGGSFDVCEIDESVLVQVAGGPPSVQPRTE